MLLGENGGGARYGVYGVGTMGLRGKNPRNVVRGPRTLKTPAYIKYFYSQADPTSKQEDVYEGRYEKSGGCSVFRPKPHQSTLSSANNSPSSASEFLIEPKPYHNPYYVVIYRDFGE